MILSWLQFCGFGILFGLLPAWWLFVGIVAEAVLNKHITIPSWLFRLAGGNPRTGAIYKGILSSRHIYMPNLILSGIYIVIVLAGFQYMVIDDFSRGYLAGLSEIAVIETSFPLFLLLTWLLPSYYLHRYLRTKIPRK